MPPSLTRPAVEAPKVAERSTKEREYTVLLTGFGPFRGLPINRSWSIVSSLPSSVPLAHSIPTNATTHTHDHGANPSTTHIKVFTYPHPIRVSYTVVKALVPTLLAAHPHVDAVIHVGLAGGRKWYAVERLAHRTGYGAPDVDGEFLAGGDWACPADKERELDWPGEIKSTINVEHVWKGWKNLCPDADVRVSDDAGRYLCDFIYYTSLANYWEEGKGTGVEERPVLFLHVPSEDEEGETLEKGVKVTMNLIKAVVDAIRAGKGV